MKRNIKLASLAAILAVLLAVSAYAAIVYYSPNIENQGNVLGYEAQLFRLDTGTQVTDIPWGGLAQGAQVTTDTIFSFTQQLTFKNTGDYSQYLGWQVNGTMPTGVSVSAQYHWNDAWFDLPQNTYSSSNGWGTDPSTGNSGISKGDHTWPIRFTLTVAGDAPRAAFTFNINIVASSTA